VVGGADRRGRGLPWPPQPSARPGRPFLSRSHASQPGPLRPRRPRLRLLDLRPLLLHEHQLRDRRAGLVACCCARWSRWPERTRWPANRGLAPGAPLNAKLARQLTSGPSRLCQALGLTRRRTTASICSIPIRRFRCATTAMRYRRGAGHAAHRHPRGRGLAASLCPAGTRLRLRIKELEGLLRSRQRGQCAAGDLLGTEIDYRSLAGFIEMREPQV
jgi:hypothetical protein